MVDHHFQVNLRGIIDLLSNHLYKGPEVFVRELLQNAVDAIRAREALDEEFQPQISLELVRPRAGKPASLVVSENGIGLTEDEIHRFLATIGESSKRGIDGERPSDFIGQFGIGLLSCFMVSETIVVVTRSAKHNAETIEWRGNSDGTYTIRKLDTDISPGTQVYLTCKEGGEDYFELDRLTELAQYYGGLLPYPIHVSCGKSSKLINPEPPPWREEFASERDRHQALLKYGRQVFNEKFFDVIPLDLANVGIDGVAYILSYAPTATAKASHRIYLKDMFLNETSDNVLPPWAFFVRLVLNTRKLKPMASREGFQEDATLRKTRQALGNCLRGYLVNLSAKDPEKLIRLIAIHHLTIKSLAVADDEFYRLVIDWLPIETSAGEMTVGEYRSQHDVLRYVTTQEQFQQISQVAAAQDMCVINGCYVYMSELLEKYPHVFDEGRIEQLEPTDIIDSFGELDEAEEAEVADFVNQADITLRPFRCHAEIKKFAPADLPILYTLSGEGRFFRSVEQSKDVANPLWSSMLDNLTPKAASGGPFAQICFNFQNRLIRRLLTVKSRKVLQRTIETLYVQSLLLGHYPLNSREMKLLNDGLLSMIELALNVSEDPA